MNRLLTSIRAAALGLAPLVLILGLLSCGNPFAPPETVDSGSPAGTVRISLGDDPSGFRTLLPEAVDSFDHYTVYFSQSEFGPLASLGTPDGTITQADMTATGYSKSGLANGKWYIGVAAYLNPGDTSPAEWGTATVTISGQSQVNATVILKPIMDEGTTGTFSYKLTKSEGLSFSGRVGLWEYTGGGGNYNNYWDSSNKVDDSNRNISSSSNSSLEGSIPLPAGVYLFKFELNPQNSPGLTGQFTKTEIVHIYSGFETKAEYAISADSFTAATVISGTIDLKLNGVEVQNGYNLFVYDDAYNNYEVSVGSNGGQTRSYSISIPRPDREMTVHLGVIYNSARISLGSVHISANVESVPHPIALDVPMITLGGTLSCSNLPEGYTINKISVWPSPERNGLKKVGSCQVNNGNWSLVMEKKSQAVPLYFDIEAYNSSGGRLQSQVTVRVLGDESRNNIDLTVNIPILKGTIRITVDGIAPTGGLRLYAFGGDNELGAVQLSGAGPEYPWSIDWRNHQDYTGPVSFKVSGDKISGYFNPAVTIGPNSIPASIPLEIALNSFIGTVNKGTVPVSRGHIIIAARQVATMDDMYELFSNNGSITRIGEGEISAGHLQGRLASGYLSGYVLIADVDGDSHTAILYSSKTAVPLPFSTPPTFDIATSGWDVFDISDTYGGGY